jgi:hypothetical protein
MVLCFYFKIYGNVLCNELSQYPISDNDLLLFFIFWKEMLSFFLHWIEIIRNYKYQIYPFFFLINHWFFNALKNQFKHTLSSYWCQFLLTLFIFIIHAQALIFLTVCTSTASNWRCELSAVTWDLKLMSAVPSKMG